MKPVLYPAGAYAAADFVNMGLGVLTDAVSCIVTEERNGEFTLSMTYPTNGRHFAEIIPQRVIYAYPCADAATPQPFEITFVSRPMGGLVQIEAIHAAQNRAAYIVCNKTYYTTRSAQSAFNWLKTVCAGYSADTFPLNLTSDIEIGTPAKFGALEAPKRVKDMLFGSEGSAIDLYGGEWEYDHNGAALKASRGQARNVVLTYGKNIADIVQETNLDGVATTVYPYWHNDTTFVYANASRLVDSSHVADFAYKRIIPVDVTEALGTDSTPTTAQVEAAGQAYINANQVGVPDISINVKFVPRSQGEEWLQALETVQLCDTVLVDYPPLGISLSAKVIRTEWDVLHDRYNDVEIGTTLRPTLATALLQYMQGV